MKKSHKSILLALIQFQIFQLNQFNYKLFHININLVHPINFNLSILTWTPVGVGCPINANMVVFLIYIYILLLFIFPFFFSS